MAGPVSAPLPPEILRLIFNHVEQTAAHSRLREIHSSYALVCRSWHTAASSLTRAVCLQLPMPAPSFRAWLRKGGQHLTQLGVAGRANARPRKHMRHFSIIPCPQLQQLHLQRFKLVLVPPAGADGGAAGGSSALAGCPGLQSLSLHRCILAEGQGALSGLAACPGLTQLTLDRVRSNIKPYHPVSLEPLSRLSSLQDLTLEGMSSNAQGSMGRLQGLTALSRLCIMYTARGSDAWDNVVDGMLTKSSSPGFAKDMAQLRHLEICCCSRYLTLEVALLSHLMSLQHLRLHDVHISSGTQEPAGQQLLHWLSGLSGLTHLDLTRSIGRYQTTPPASMFTALTACSNLRDLNLADCGLPRGVWRHMFAAQQQLTRLQVPLPKGTMRQVNGMDGDDLSLLVAARPGLQVLDISRTLQRGVSLEPLQRLSALTSLRVGPLDMEAAAVQLAVLTGLSALDIQDTHFDDLQLMQLSTLTRLAYLHRLGFRHPFTFSTCDIALRNQAPPGRTPDVCQQLEQYCRSSIQCQHVYLRQELAVQQQRAEVQEQRAHAQQQRAEAQEQCAEELARQLARLQAQHPTNCHRWQ